MTHTKQWQAICARMATTGLLYGLLTIPLGATAAPVEPEANEDIPTHIVLPEDPDLYPDPICLGCKIIAKRAKASSGANGDEGGILRVTYVDDKVPVFQGDIVLTVFLLDTEAHRTMMLEGIELSSGHAVELLVSPGADWSWDEVESVWVELVTD